ncbi:MAG TPA: TIGR03560 family F420-dependent LLM class oxidoreductase [Acidimicrobiales bacterium]|nr:TIGR03560 family F420-dependent LLM class oxidoreductase [Acidimicrobiales bacterium]
MRVRGRPFRFGIQLRPQRTTWARYIAAVQSVEELGFDTVWSSDHLLPASGPDDGPRFETLTILGAIAALTNRVRFGPLVFGALYRDPATLAKSVATVDEISGGRLEFALGAAWSEREFRAYGLAYPPLAERYARLDESLQILRSLWTEPRTKFEGRYYRIDDAPCEPKPVQRPHPPIMVGGVGAGALRIAAKHATSSNLCGLPETVAKKAQLLEQFCGDIGRHFDAVELSVHSDIAIASTSAAAEACMSDAVARDGLNIEAQRDLWVTGSPGQVVDQVGRYAEVGVSHWIVHIDDPFDLTTLQMLREQVVPQFK